MLTTHALILISALALDLLFGEPPNRVHPVVWMGRWIAWGESRLERDERRHAPPARLWVAFSAGTGIVLVGAAFVSMVALASAALQSVDYLLYILVSAWLLKTTFAVRALAQAARAVQSALRDGNLLEARRLLAWHLVSRDTTTLDERLIVAATIESVAENFGDGIVAPLFYFALFGLPGALVYRFANTADAMLGYRDARREYLGKFAARLDDLINLAPSRLAAILLSFGAAVSGASSAGAWRIAWRDHARTASPNAGWPMSAMAGALDVTLVKVGYYALGDGDGALDAAAITRSLRVMAAASALGVVFVVGII
ncbi:MAG: cobalamin biosynthesis protein, partial [Chloroflexota bacterium]